MLMKKIRDTYREITGYIEPVAPITMVPRHRTAANAGNIAKSDMQARRDRRQRRMERVGISNVSGWTVRSW
jgi:hypothetical protein